MNSFQNQFCKIVFRNFVLLIVFEGYFVGISQKKYNFEKILKKCLQIVKKYIFDKNEWYIKPVNIFIFQK